MANQYGKMEELKFKLKIALSRRINIEKIENTLRIAERSMIEEMSLIKTEEEFVLQQLEAVKKEISLTKNHIIMIDICNASEKAKIESSLAELNSYKKKFELFFEKEREISELFDKKAREKEAEQAELERQEKEKFLQLNEQKYKEVIAIENECDAIERECSILTKRNKAIMLKIRRKLIEAEETRRNLSTKHNSSKK